MNEEMKFSSTVEYQVFDGTEWKSESTFECAVEKIRISEKETSHPGFLHALASARFAMEEPIYNPEPGQSVYDILCGIAGALRESGQPPQVSIISGRVNNFLLRAQSRINQAKRRRKIERKQKRAVFRRRKRGLA